MKNNAYEFWFITGSQFLYGEETLRQVEADSLAIIAGLNASGNLPFPVVCKGTMKTNEGIVSVVREANYAACCAGVITFCHTFSPSKMWINGLNLLQKPYLHFHTQFNEIIPNEEIDMDYMNLHQSAHGDREHGFIGTRMRLPRKVVVGYWGNEEVQKKIGKWMRAAVGAVFSQSLKVMRFGDNMREVAVTEGDKVEAQIKLGWQVNTWPVGTLVEAIEAVTEAEVEAMIAGYKERYTLATDDLDTVRYQAREEAALKKLLDAEGCLAPGARGLVKTGLPGSIRHEAAAGPGHAGSDGAGLWLWRRRRLEGSGHDGHYEGHGPGHGQRNLLYGGLQLRFQKRHLSGCAYAGGLPQRGGGACPHRGARFGHW